MWKPKAPPLAPLGWCLDRQSAQIELGADDRQRLWRWVRWEEEPAFPFPGRTAWMPLTEPVPHPSAKGLLLRAAKVKGLGFGQSDGEAPSPVDGERDYTPVRERAHLGIGADGRYEKAFSEPAPLGGIVLPRALLEYENAARLLAASVPATVPLAVFRHQRRYRGSPLAVVVTLSPEPTPFRLTSLIAGEDAISSAAEQQHRLAAERALGLPVPLSSPAGLARTLANLAAAIGAALRSFNTAGLHRHSSGLGNFQYCCAWQRLLLLDLDSSRELAGLGFEHRGLEILRDLAAAVHKVIETIYLHPQLLRDAGLARIARRDPLLALLRGYFADLPTARVRRASDAIWGYVLPQALALDRRRRAAGADWPRREREMDEAEKWTIYALTMMVCQPLLAASKLSELGLAPAEAVAVDRAAPLLGDGALYLEWAAERFI